MKTDENGPSKFDGERRELVLAAEGVIRERFARGRLAKPQKTQFSNLVGVCHEAHCAEEIANYLRYQAGRGDWEREFTDMVIDGVAPTIKKHESDDNFRVGVWKLYATFLLRAYVYQDAATRLPRTK